jgi:hypothetical protein
MKSQATSYIPVDFIKANIIGLSKEHFEENLLLTEHTSIFKGDLLDKTIYAYKNIRIKVFENCSRIEFSGSLHTFYNEGIHNHNDFNEFSFNTALSNLYIDLKIKPDNLYIFHLEWGFNITPPKTSAYILDRLVQHKSINATVGIDSKKDGKYVQFQHSAMTFKIYNKALHFGLDEEILRIEIKQTNWSSYRSKGIETFDDFIRYDKAIFLHELISQWERIIFYDINDKKSVKYIRYHLPTFWDDLRKNRSSKNFKYHSDKLKNLNQTLGFNTQNKVSLLIMKKGKEYQLKI